MSEWVKKQLSQLALLSKGQQMAKIHLEKEGDYYVLNGGQNPSGYLNKWNTEADTISISEGGNSCGYVAYNSTRFWSGGHNYALKNLSKEILDSYKYLRSDRAKASAIAQELIELASRHYGEKQ